MAKQKLDWVDLYARARWDRLLGVVVVLVLVIILISVAVRSCGKDDEKSPTGRPLQEATQPTTEPPVNPLKMVYLSPSTQYDNLYACDNSTTEAAAMIDLAKRIKALLEADGYTVYMCGEKDNVRQKVAAGNQLRCGAYIALHSNSGGESGNGQGTECFYNTKVPGSRALAECVYNNMAALTPTKDRGLKDETQRDLYEVYNNITACCLLEVEFHDIPQYAQWILDNQDASAKAIADGIKTYLSIAEAPPAEGATDETRETMAWNPEIQH